MTRHIFDITLLLALASLTLTGCSTDEDNPVAPIPDPVAVFTMSEATVTPATIIFNNHSQNADQYEWDFGDGMTSVQQNPSVTFNSYGQYEIKLIASRSESGRSDTAYQSLRISPGHIFVETIRVEQIPFVDGDGNGWDIDFGPDLSWSINNIGHTVLVESDIYYEDVSPADLPKTFTQPPLPYQLPNASAQYTIRIWDYDSVDSEDYIGGGTFDLSYEMLSGNYVSEIYWDNPQRPFRMRVTIRWQ